MTTTTETPPIAKVVGTKSYEFFRRFVLGTLKSEMEPPTSLVDKSLAKKVAKFQESHNTFMTWLMGGPDAWVQFTIPEQSFTKDHQILLSLHNTMFEGRGDDLYIQQRIRLPSGGHVAINICRDLDIGKSDFKFFYVPAFNHSVLGRVVGEGECGRYKELIDKTKNEEFDQLLAGESLMVTAEDAKAMEQYFKSVGDRRKQFEDSVTNHNVSRTALSQYKEWLVKTVDAHLTKMTRGELYDYAYPRKFVTYPRVLSILTTTALILGKYIQDLKSTDVSDLEKFYTLASVIEEKYMLAEQTIAVFKGGSFSNNTASLATVRMNHFGLALP